MTSLPAGQHVSRAIHKASPFVEKLARFGYAAKGVVYVIVGTLAAMAAFGTGGETTGSRGALHTIMDQPFGQVMLGLVAVGLFGYALWQFVRAVEDPENEGSDGKALAKRATFLISGIIHLGLVLAAIRLLTGSMAGRGGDDAGTQDWTATLMSYPAGQWLVAAVGLIIGGYGIGQAVKGYRSDLDDQLELHSLSPGPHRWTIRISRFGMIARGVVFMIIGALLVVAAVHNDPSEAKGVGGALDALARQPYGPWLLGAVALGLVAYGLYQFILARYRHIEVA